MPATYDGMTSSAESLPTHETSRVCNQGAADACSPASAQRVPGADLRAPGQAPGLDKDRISRAHGDATHRLPGVQVFHVDWHPRLEIRHPFEARDVKRHAAGHDAELQVLDAPFSHP